MTLQGRTSRKPRLSRSFALPNRVALPYNVNPHESLWIESFSDSCGATSQGGMSRKIPAQTELGIYLTASPCLRQVELSTQAKVE